MPEDPLPDPGGGAARAPRAAAGTRGEPRAPVRPPHPADVAPDEPAAVLGDAVGWSRAPDWCAARDYVHPPHGGPLPDGSHWSCPGTGRLTSWLKPHVCHFVEPNGHHNGFCHLRPPHGGRCRTCVDQLSDGRPIHATAAECVHQVPAVTAALCATPGCVVHGDASHLLADATWVDGRDRFVVSLDDVNVRRDEDGAAVVDLAFDDDHAAGQVGDVPPRLVLDRHVGTRQEAPYPIFITGDLGVEFTRDEALALGLALLALVREHDHAHVRTAPLSPDAPRIRRPNLPAETTDLAAFVERGWTEAEDRPTEEWETT